MINRCICTSINGLRIDYPFFSDWTVFADFSARVVVSCSHARGETAVAGG